MELLFLFEENARARTPSFVQMFWSGFGQRGPSWGVRRGSTLERRKRRRSVRRRLFGANSPSLWLLDDVVRDDVAALVADQARSAVRAVVWGTEVHGLPEREIGRFAHQRAGIAVVDEDQPDVRVALVEPRRRK